MWRLGSSLGLGDEGAVACDPPIPHHGGYLFQPAPPTGAKPSPVTLLTFTLDRLRVALPASDVREVVRAVAVTPLPSAPDVVEGVIDFRGTVIAVADPRIRFQVPPRPLDPTQHFIVAWAGSRLIALRVDSAESLVRVDPEAIEASGQALAGAPHVAGVARADDGLVVIHDLVTFLDAEEARRLDEALASREAP